MKSKQHSHRRIVVNIFGTLGYLSVFLQWTWTAIILLYPLFQSEAVQKIFLPERQAPRPVVSHSGCYSDAAPFIAIVSIAITAAIIVMSIITLIGLPKKIGKTGAKITHSAADVIAANTRPPKQQPAKKWKLNLSYKLIICIKLILTVLPVILLLFAPTIPKLPHQVMTIVGNFCLVVSAVYWLIQYALAKILRVPHKEIWKFKPSAG